MRAMRLAMVPGGRAALALVVLAVIGCQATGTVTTPRPGRGVQVPSLARTAFAIAPIGEGLPEAAPVVSGPPVLREPASLPVPAEPVAPPARLPAESADRLVRITGVARVPEEASAMANVRAGFITGTPVVALDARTGRRLAEAITYYDGSFALEVPLAATSLPVVISTSLVDAGDANLTLAITAPVVLKDEERDVRLALSPGSTALTAFLGAVAGLEDGAVTALTTAAGGDPGLTAGPRFGALVAGIDEGERESFARLAEAAPELKAASNVVTLRDGIRRFVGRIAVRKAG